MVLFAKDIREKPYGGSFWLFLFFSFVYGVIHALGPGHGKIFAASYFLNRPGGLGAGLLFGNLTMFVHVLSATTLVLAGYHLLHASAAMTVDVVGDRLETISFGLLLALGLALTAKSCLDLRTGHAHQREHSRQPSPKTDMRSLVGMSLAVGLIPCPGAALILIFSLSLGITIAGLLAMACISLGMGLTISAVALLVISSRGLVLRLIQGHDRLYRTGHACLSLCGSLVVTVLGGVLLLGKWG